MNIEDLSIRQAKELLAMFQQFGKDDSLKVKTHSIKIGEAYLIRTVTMMYTGRVCAITDFDLELEDAAWIADSGRYSNALVNGELSEVEPYPNGCVVTRQGIIDFAPWAHALPIELK